MLHYFLTQFSPTLLISALLLAAYLAQQHSSPLLFLPAGIQLMAVVVYSGRALPGCIIGMGLGALLLSHHPVSSANLGSSAIYAVLSTLSLLGAIYLTCRLGRINDQLAGLHYRHVLSIVFVQALTDAALRTSLLPAPEQQPEVQLLIQATGNLLGSMAVVLTLWILFSLRRRHTH